MKLPENKSKEGKIIKNPSFDVSKIDPEIQEAMEKWQEHQRKEQHELSKQTWPTWLLPEGFEGWYRSEQKWRHDTGRTLLPTPPPEVIAEVLELNKKGK